MLPEPFEARSEPARLYGGEQLKYTNMKIKLK